MKSSRIVIKVGTKVLTNQQGVLDRASLANIASQIAALMEKGYTVVLVSSGAMGAGKSLLKTTRRLTSISEKQLYAAIGQAYLINEYSTLFREHGLLCAQVLATKEDFRDKSHFLNMRSCMETLLHDKVVPIVNENDVVALGELTFTDNDELAGQVASMINADRLMLLSSVPGVLNDEGVVIDEITLDNHYAASGYITTEKSEAGRGGMKTKFLTAKKMASQGIETIIANGTDTDIMLRLMAGEKLGTRFTPGKRKAGLKRRLAHSDNLVQGVIKVNDGAAKMLREQNVSLLFVGVSAITGSFYKGDIIAIHNQAGKQIGYGISRYDSDETHELIGQRHVKPLIHYDYLFME